MHIENAMLAIDGSPMFTDTPSVYMDLQALEMPSEVFQARERPRVEEQWWEIFGDELPYDLIPVRERVGK